MKKKMSKMIRMSIAAMLILLLAGCGAKEENKSNSDIENTNVTKTDTEEETGPIYLKVLTDRPDLINTKLDEYKLSFEASHENVIVEYVPITYYEDGASKKIEAQDYGDVLLIPDSVTNDRLADLFEPLGTVEELSEKYNPLFLNDRQVDGIVYGIPRYANVQGVLYNKKVFENAGVIELPKTPEEFMEVLRKIYVSQPDVIPYYTNYRDGDVLSMWHSHILGSVSANSNYRNVVMTSQRDIFTAGKPAYVAYQLLYDIIEKGYSEKPTENYNRKTIARMMNHGEIGCMVGDVSLWREFQLSGVNTDDIGYMPFPYSVNGQQYATMETDYSYAVNKNSGNKELAKEWIRFMINKSGFAASENRLSVKNEASLPESMADFKDVELLPVSYGIGENEGKYEKLENLSGLNFEDGTAQVRLVKAAMRQLAKSDSGDDIEEERLGEGEKEEKFAAILEEWNERWNKALEGKNSEQKASVEKGE